MKMKKQQKKLQKLKRKKENTIKYFMKASENEELFTTIAMEECAELIQAISKAKRGKLDADNMAEEIADVLIGIEWLKELYDIDAL